MSLRGLLSDYVDWERPYITTDDSRGSTRVFRKYEISIPCLIQAASSRDMLLFAQRQVVATHCVYFDKILPLLPGDRFYVAPRDGLPARYFIISGWVDQGGQRGRCFCVHVKEQA